jgi:uncharacterized protein (TIGR00299 family) protein
MKSSRIAYFDCFSGISGDMVLGALVDAGADLRAIEAELRKLGLEGWTISAEKVKRGAIFATHVKVQTSEEHHHRGLSIILGRIDKAGLAPRAAERARRIFTRLAEAEARVHNVPVEEVHFHEVGAVDSIVDIVGAAIGFELLGIDEFACSALDVGAGQVKTAHGLLPVPAPATAELLRGAPMCTSGIARELVTPTGAAIATTLSTRYAQIPEMTLQAVGYGAGSADLKEKANVLRILIGESATSEAGEHWDAPVSVIETNLDDMSPQIYGYFVERALAAGALDVFSTAVQMKKNRPGVLLTILVRCGAYGEADRSGFSRDHYNWSADLRCAAKSAGQGAGAGRDSVWRSAHEDFADEWFGAECDAGVRRLPAARGGEGNSAEAGDRRGVV